MFNSVFYKKKHRAYQLRERAERREKMLEEKYNDHLMQKSLEEKKINDEFIKRDKQTSEQLDERSKTRKRMAL